MQYTNLPGTGVKVSRVGLGTMMLGDQVNEADSLAIIDYAVDQGINFLDTASSYIGGKGEKILGKWLKGRRDKVIIATKIFYPISDDMNDRGLSRRHIMATINKSLINFNTDYIDLVYMHAPDYETELEETLDTLTSLVRAGKIRYLGVSNYAAWQIADILAISDKKGYIKPIVSQNVYNLLLRDVEFELLPCLKAHKMGMVAYNPIAAGLLSGKYKTRELQENTRFALKKLYYDRYWHDKYFDAVEKLSGVADKYGLSLLELAFRWCVCQSGDTSLLCGVSKLEQLKQNIKVFEGPALSEEILKDCNRIWEDMEGKTFFYHR